MLKYSARSRGSESGFEVPVFVTGKIGTFMALARRSEIKVEEVPANHRRRHGSLRAFHFCHILLKGEDMLGAQARRELWS